MRAVLLLGVILAVSLVVNVAQYRALDRQHAKIAAYEAEKRLWDKKRTADETAAAQVMREMREAASLAQDGRDTLHEADKTDDDSLYLERVGRMWRERATQAGGGDTTRDAAR